MVYPLSALLFSRLRTNPSYVHLRGLSPQPSSPLLLSFHTNTMRAERIFKDPSARLFEYDDRSLLAM